jgi:nucleolar protein 56
MVSEENGDAGLRIKFPFGVAEGKKLSEEFSKDPKIAAKEYLESDAKTQVSEISAKSLFPYKDYPKWLNEFSVELAKLKIASKDPAEGEFISLARAYEELSHFQKSLKNRGDLLKSYDSYPILLKNTEKLKDKIEKKIRKQAERLAPNTSALLGPVLSARLISKAGGLERLAKMPVSKIQILGAEKSLFRYLKDKEEGRDTKTPKYGIIYLSPYILNASANRGKIARLLASKIMVSSRMDYFSKEDRSEKIKAEFLESYKKLSK